MQSLAAAVLLLISCGPSSATARKYTLIKDYTSNGVAAFFDSFDFFTGPDPTNGFVQYLDRSSAISTGLAGYTAPNTSTSPNAIYLGVEHTAPATSPGRPSIRIASTATYGPGTLIVADIAHSPGGVCGTWPALWLLGTSAPWPLAGELDIFEQVSLATQNAVTAHTGPGCALRRNGTGAAYSGSLATADCNVDAPAQPRNAGCSIDAAAGGAASFGTLFNDAGGGVYVAEWMARRGFNVWFFPRGAVPSALMGGDDDAGRGVETARFGRPMARLTGSGCDWDSNFRDMQIIINTSLCGDWAGTVWVSAGCAASTGVATCEEFVAGNPEAFAEAYWALAGLRVYGESEGPDAQWQI